eukprot:1317934-Pyramimonas_sp.AAC.1
MASLRREAKLRMTRLARRRQRTMTATNTQKMQRMNATSLRGNALALWWLARTLAAHLHRQPVI